MNPYNHIMVDIESAGNGACAIGAVPFELEGNGKLGSPFHAAISLESLHEHGLEPRGDTISWWLDQPDGVMRMELGGAMSLPDAMAAFNGWLEQRSSVNKLRMWAWPPSYDFYELRRNYDACGIEPYWARRFEMCAKSVTRAHLDEKIERAYREHPPHNMRTMKHYSVYDATVQVGLIQQARRAALMRGVTQEIREAIGNG